MDVSAAFASAIHADEQPSKPVLQRFVMLGTGVRIAEALMTLEREHVDLDALTLPVLDKGQKVRLVPISVEGRKALFRCLTRSEGRFVFGTIRGRRWTNGNAHRGVTAFPVTLTSSGVSAPTEVRLNAVYRDVRQSFVIRLEPLR